MFRLRSQSTKEHGKTSLEYSTWEHCQSTLRASVTPQPFMQTLPETVFMQLDWLVNPNHSTSSSKKSLSICISA